MPTATFEEACRSKLGIQNLTAKKMSFVFVEYQRCSLVSTLVTFMSNCFSEGLNWKNCFSQGLNWNQHQGCELSKAQYMRSIEMKTIILGGVSVRDASAAKNRKPANLQIKPLDVEKLELNVNHLTIAIQPSIISGRPHI